MGDSSLSQDEIDALLQGADDVSDLTGMGGAGGASGGIQVLSAQEKDALGNLLASSLNSAGTSIGAMLGGRDVKISFSSLEVKTQDQIKSGLIGQFVSIDIPFSTGITGSNVFIFNQKDAIAIGSVLMGGDPSSLPAEIDDGILQTFQEPLQILVSSMATAISKQLNKSIQTSPPDAKILASAAELVLPKVAQLIEIEYNIVISNLIDSAFYHIMTFDMGRELAGLLSGTGSPQIFEKATVVETAPSPGSVGISPVKFPSFTSVPAYTGQGNIDLLMDVPMTLTVELGRAKMMIKDILSLGEGSIIELDKLAGEPVDLLINGKLIGKGEVVVIDENFGVRVTDIVSPMDRVKTFGSG
jgi:flagellar motor switch protein FliN/FliY